MHIKIGDLVVTGTVGSYPDFPLARGIIKDILPARRYQPSDTGTVVIEEEDGSESYWCPEDVYLIY